MLPGVTVEAASPALIEKVRTASAEGAGQYADSRSESGDVLGLQGGTWHNPTAVYAPRFVR